MSLEIYRSVYRVLLTIQQYNGCIAERNNICYYSCIMGAIITPSLLSQRDNYITMLCCDVIPAARPITNVFYFRCITPPWHTHSFSRNSIISVITNPRTIRKIFPFIPSLPPEGCATRVIHTCLTIYGHIPLLERERERERIRVLFYYVHIRITTDTSWDYYRVSFREKIQRGTHGCTVTSITNHRLFPLPFEGKMTKVSGCLISLPAESRWWPTHANNTTLPRDSTIDTLPVTIRVITCVRYSSCLRRDALMGIKRLELSEFSGKKFYPNESGHLEVGEIPCKKIFISWIEFLIFFEICNTLSLFLSRLNCE